MNLPSDDDIAPGGDTVASEPQDAPQDAPQRPLRLTMAAMQGSLVAEALRDRVTSPAPAEQPADDTLH